MYRKLLQNGGVFVYVDPPIGCQATLRMMAILYRPELYGSLPFKGFIDRMATFKASFTLESVNCFRKRTAFFDNILLLIKLGEQWRHNPADSRGQNRIAGRSLGTFKDNVDERTSYAML